MAALLGAGRLDEDLAHVAVHDVQVSLACPLGEQRRIHVEGAARVGIQVRDRGVHGAATLSASRV